jgi:hypothetical protein
MIMLSYLFTILGLSTASLGQTLPADEFRDVFDAPHGYQQYRASIAIGPAIDLPAAIEVTPRRNGTLAIANLSLRVLDEYNDPLMYERGMLHVKFIDLSGDGYKDLLITGIAVRTGEKSAAPTSREVITNIYIFNPVTRQFKEVLRIGPRLNV